MSLTNDKRTLYVGGLEESVTLDVLRAAFVPFGELVDVNLPTDPSGQKHRGFAFVQYEEQGDAADAIDNMDNAELYGRVPRSEETWQYYEGARDLRVCY